MSGEIPVSSKERSDRQRRIDSAVAHAYLTARKLPATLEEFQSKVPGATIYEIRLAFQRMNVEL